MNALATATEPTSYYLVDLENLVRGVHADAATALDALEAVARATGRRTGDLAVVAADHRLIVRVGFDRPFPCQLVTAFRGPDGADRALLAQARLDWIVTRFDRVVIASGDHAFAELAAACVAAGLEVVVVGLRRSIHHSFWRIGCTVVHLDDHLGRTADADPDGSVADVIPFPVRRSTTGPAPEGGTAIAA